MKTKIGINLIFIMLFFWIGCTDDLEYIPIDQLTTERIMGDLDLLQTATYANYARGRQSPATFMRLSELQSDDNIMMRWSSNNMSNTLTYLQIVNNANAASWWQNSYRTIFACNVIIEAITDDDNAEMLNLKGENIWMRAQYHFDLVRIFGRPFSHDNPETNLGIPLCDNTDVYAMPSRATVKETYEFIEKDLLRAAELLTITLSNVYVSKEVVWATLARLYIYWDKYDKAIEYANKVINSGRYGLLSTEQLPTCYLLTPEEDSEAIFAVKFRPEENQGLSSKGTMWHRDGGWGELMVTKTLMDLLWKNKDDDQRIKYIDPHYKYDADGNKIPDPTEPYYGYALNDRMGLLSYHCLKFTKEQGINMLHSPRLYRLAEMYLIKAEAHAKLGQDQLALDNVNLIRTRAGLSGDQLFRLDNLQGYTSILDIVLDEKRMEFFQEAHRAYDVFRNKRTLDRTYCQWQGWSGPPYIPYWSNRILHFVPEREMTINPNLVQNPDLEPLEDLPTSMP